MSERLSYVYVLSGNLGLQQHIEVFEGTKDGEERANKRKAELKSGSKSWVLTIDKVKVQ